MSGVSGSDHRAQKRLGRFLNDIPGLTPDRLGELQAAVQHVTQDTGAIGNVTLFARGGMRIEIHWKQNGTTITYPALMSAEEMTTAIELDDDELFTRFSTRTLEAVREMRNKLAGAEPPTEGERQPDFKPVPGAMESLSAAIQAGLIRTIPNPPAEPASEGEKP